MSALRLQWAFLRRDWSYETSYRGMMILQLLGIVGTLIIFYSIGLLVGDNAQSLEEYGGEYFPFALIGLSVSDYFNTGLRSFSSRLRLAQTTGTLEAMLATPTPARSILIFSGAWDFLVASVRLVIALAVGVLFFDVTFEVDLPATVLLAALSLLTFAALGVIAAAVILVVKRGDAVAALGNIFASVFAGALFPVTLLPNWLEWVAYILPLHYALDGLRRATLSGDGIGELALNVIVLGIAATLLLPLSLLVLEWATDQVRREGSVGLH